jgi:hypothetical protein
LPDLPAAGQRAFLYHLDRQQFLGLRLIRWLYIVLFLGTLLWGVAGLPGGWWVSLLWLLAALLLGITMWQARRQGFVRFHESPAPPVRPQPMPPSYKIAVYVSGKLTVENKVRLFAGLPGFYRTFATREHALLCQARSRQFGVSKWPQDEEGLWYAFFMPGAIQQVRAGTIELAKQVMPALAVDYRPLPAPGRRQGPKLAEIETLLLAFQEEEERLGALADLLADAPATSSAGILKTKRRQ